jgi:hypothetical protein
MSPEEGSTDVVEQEGVPWDDEGDDEEPVSREAVTQAVVTDTDWTAETILSQLRRGNIQLNPRFQRRDAWDPTRKSRFIESLILGLPIPQLVLAEDKRRRGAFIVLDGKQRLLTLRQFAEGSPLGMGPTAEKFRELRLSRLDVRPDLHGYNLARLEDEPERLDDLNAILNQTVRTVVVRRWPDEDFLNLVFLRLNTGSVPLSPQELRQALHPGPFTNFVDDAAVDSLEVRRALRIKTEDFRMRDVEILLRYIAFRQFLPEYRGNLKAFLDMTAERFNKQWDQLEREAVRLVQEFNESIDVAFKVFGNNAFFRWESRLGRPPRYERRFNRALFDAVMYHLQDSTVRARAVERHAQVENALKKLCTDDDEFVQSIQATTKTIGATFTRISKWGAILSKVLGLKLFTPEILHT